MDGTHHTPKTPDQPLSARAKDDFAASYMQQNSPTLLFLQRLVASQTVLFIGYSLKDTLMDYILPLRLASPARRGVILVP